MIQHFKFEPLYTKELPGWKLTFYAEQQRFEAIYHKEGKIEVVSPAGSPLHATTEKQIHELMLYHIYN